MFCVVETYDYHYLCEMEEEAIPPEWRMYRMGQKITVPTPSNYTLHVPTITCPDEHVTYLFLACDAKADCWKEWLHVVPPVESK